MKVRWYWALAALLLVLMFIAGMLFSGCDGDNTEKDKTPQIEIGAVMEASSSTAQTLCATTQDNYKQLMKYLVAGDKAGAEKMLRQGQIFLLKSGTPVKVISVTLNGVEVRVQEGPHKDDIAWIQSEFLK